MHPFHTIEVREADTEVGTLVGALCSNDRLRRRSLFYTPLSYHRGFLFNNQFVFGIITTVR